MSDNEARQATKVDKIIGKRLREKRIERGMTQDELAEALSVTYQQIQKYETGFTRIAASRLYEMSKALNCTPLDLLPLDTPGGDSEAAKLMAVPDALAVARGFAKIKDAEGRRAVINLIKALVFNSHTNGNKGGKGRH